MTSRIRKLLDTLPSSRVAVDRFVGPRLSTISGHFVEISSPHIPLRRVELRLEMDYPDDPGSAIDHRRHAENYMIEALLGDIRRLSSEALAQAHTGNRDRVIELLSEVLDECQ